MSVNKYEVGDMNLESSYKNVKIEDCLSQADQLYIDGSFAVIAALACWDAEYAFNASLLDK